MRRIQAGWLAWTVVCVLPGVVLASDDRLGISADGASLTGTDGGYGGSLSWLHNFDPDTLAGIGAEHQKLGVSQWTFGSLTGAMTTGEGDRRYTFSGEAHEGAGVDKGKHFNYAIEALGVTGTYFHRLSVQVEDKQINVETTHGNLPKIGLSYLLNPHFQMQASYSYSFGGNLGTRLPAVRIDVYGTRVNFLAGGAWGTVSPIVLGVQTVLPPRPTHEGYVGLSVPLPHLRSEITVLADYIYLRGGTFTDPTLGLGPNTVPNSTKLTGTVNWVVHLGGKK
ncbi:MAG TPA: hypothetical protein VGL55_14145 [Steroidobacteraceae bacterium]|jgi:hypothetical protein